MHRARYKHIACTAATVAAASASCNATTAAGPARAASRQRAETLQAVAVKHICYVARVTVGLNVIQLHTEAGAGGGELWAAGH